MGSFVASAVHDDDFWGVRRKVLLLLLRFVRQSRFLKKESAYFEPCHGAAALPCYVRRLPLFEA